MAATLTAGAAAKERTDDVRIVYSDAPADLEAALIDAASRALKVSAGGCRGTMPAGFGRARIPLLLITNPR